jgi:hypothetical protein
MHCLTAEMNYARLTRASIVRSASSGGQHNLTSEVFTNPEADMSQLLVLPDSGSL